MFEIKIKCAAELIGKNSETPWTTESKKISKKSEKKIVKKEAASKKTTSKIVKKQPIVKKKIKNK